MKKTKRSLAVLLAVLMVCGALFCVPAAAASGTPAAPVIYVHGFMGCSLYGGLDTDSPYQIFGPTDAAIKDTVGSALVPVTEFLTHADWEKLVDDATPVMQNLLGPSYCDENGDPAPNTGAKWSYPSPEEVRSSVSTEFEYDWRLSPILLARQLAAYIDYVCECTGKPKVSLICHSYGNCVGMAYVAQYGVDKLDGFIYNASAFLGETYTGELFSGNLVVGGPMFINYLRSNAFFGNDAGKALCDVLELMFVGDSVEQIAAQNLPGVMDKLARQIFIPWFGCYMSIWAMVPDEYYEDARAYIFDHCLAGEDRSGMLAKLDEFDRVVRSRREEILSQMESVAHVGVVSRYNVQMAPVSPGCGANSDGTIDVKYTSFGATAADYGETLPDGYRQAAHTDVNYLSSDRVIDASTCRWPEKTWFIKDMKHDAMSYGNLQELFYRILGNDGYTVTADADFPQFLIYNVNGNDLVLPLAGAPKQKTSFILKLLEIFKLLRKLFLGFIA